MKRVIGLIPIILSWGLVVFLHRTSLVIHSAFFWGLGALGMFISMVLIKKD